MSILRFVRNQWDRTAAWVLVALGGLAIVLGWVGVSNEGLTAQQIPYIVSGGIGGLFLLGLGATSWLSADLRDEWRKLDEIGRALADVEPAPAPPGSSEDPFAADDGGLPADTASAGRRQRPLEATSR